MKDYFYEPDPSNGKDINKMDVEELITLRESLKLYQYDKTEHLKSKKDKKSKWITIIKGINAVLCAGVVVAILVAKLFMPEFILLASIAGVDGLFSGISFAREIKDRLEYKNAIEETEHSCTEKINEINKIIDKKFSNYKYKTDAVKIADQVISSMKIEESKVQNQKARRSKRFISKANNTSLEKAKTNNEMIR